MRSFNERNHGGLLTALLKSVLIIPGAMQLTRILRCAQDVAIAFVRPSSVVFVTPYALIVYEGNFVTGTSLKKVKRALETACSR